MSGNKCMSEPEPEQTTSPPRSSERPSRSSARASSSGVSPTTGVSAEQALLGVVDSGARIHIYPQADIHGAYLQARAPSTAYTFVPTERTTAGVEREVRQAVRQEFERLTAAGSVFRIDRPQYGLRLSPSQYQALYGDPDSQDHIDSWETLAAGLNRRRPLTVLRDALELPKRSVLRGSCKRRASGVLGGGAQCLLRGVPALARCAATAVRGFALLVVTFARLVLRTPELRRGWSDVASQAVRLVSGSAGLAAVAAVVIQNANLLVEIADFLRSYGR